MRSPVTSLAALPWAGTTSTLPMEEVTVAAAHVSNDQSMSSTKPAKARECWRFMMAGYP
jgi:hypothetical protein